METPKSSFGKTIANMGIDTVPESKTNKWSKDKGALVLKAIAQEFDLELTEEFKFCPHGKRKYAMDYCFVSLKIGIEFDGGVWAAERKQKTAQGVVTTKMGHSSGKGITRDIEKGNYAQIHGYMWLRFTYQQELSYMVDTIKEAIKNKLNTNV